MRQQALRWPFLFALGALVACPGSEPSEPSIPGLLPGAPGAPATAAIPRLRFSARGQDYRADHPDMPGLFVSHNTVILAFELDTTVQQANEVLADAEAQIVGGYPGTAGQSEGLLAIRIPSADHDDLQRILDQLRGRAEVLDAVPDAMLQGLRVFSTAGAITGWTWETTPAGGNWGLELIRAPQMWNPYVTWLKNPQPAPVGVVDTGFAKDHEDLVYAENRTPTAQDFHGTLVAGIIGAGCGNGRGIDGINCWPELVVQAITASVAAGPLPEVMTAVGEMILGGFTDFIEARPDVQVINLSIGYDWQDIGQDPTASRAIRGLVSSQGLMFALAQNLWREHRPGLRLPLLVTAAGNDSAAGWGDIPAYWASPFNYAGIELHASNILVIESIDNAPAMEGGAWRSAFSNLGGDLSAPGADVVSAYFDPAAPNVRNLYAELSGTSMAAPHATGLIGVLLSFAPDLDNDQIIDLLVDNAVSVSGDASDRIDAFASVMDIDRLRQNARVLTMLVDVDDGTVDGNRRVDLMSGAENTSDDVDNDGGPGDGQIDMSDFRRFRDWLLQAEGHADLMLDGRADHPKKDLNGDGQVGPPPQENVHPRGDFNGDGQLSRTATRYVPGAIGAEVTDLQVLERVFDDPHYEAADLGELLDSGDIVINATDCLELQDAARLESSLWRLDAETPHETRRHEEDAEVQMYTVPVHGGGYTARVEVLDARGDVIATDEQHLPVNRGQDGYWEPSCQPAEKEWRRRLGQTEVLASVAVNPVTGVIYALADHLYAFNPDGSQVWMLELCGASISSPTIHPANDRIIFGLWSGGRAHLYAVEPWGDIAWKFETELLAGATIHSSPAIGPGPDYDIYFTAQDDFLYSVRGGLYFATLNWKVPVVASGYLPVSSPVVNANGTRVYVGGGDGYLYAIEPGFNPIVHGGYRTGGPIRSTPALAPNGTIYVGSDDNKLHAITPQGSQLWTFTTNGNVVSSPAIGADGTIYVGSEDRYLYAVNPDGTQKWRFETQGPVVSSPAIGADGTIYFGSNDDNVYALYPDGRLRWKLDHRNGWFDVNFQGPVTITDTGQVFAGGSDGNLYAIDSGVDEPGLASSPWPKFHRDNVNSGRQQ